MSTRFRLTRRSADRLLDAPTVGADEPLGAILRAASTAPSAGELPGEDVAVMQFRAARLSPETTLGGSSLMSRTVRKLLAVPAAGLAAAGVLVAGGGVAFAASQGALQVPFTGHDNRSPKAPTAPASENPGLSQTHSPATPSADATQAPSGTPSPSLDGLCHAFQAGANHNGEDNPAFAALTAAAGGADKVSAYCVDRIGPSTKPTHPAKPTQAASPTHPAKPTQAASPTHPAKPTQAPTPPRPTQAPEKPSQAH